MAVQRRPGPTAVGIRLVPRRLVTAMISEGLSAKARDPPRRLENFELGVFLFNLGESEQTKYNGWCDMHTAL